MQTFSSANTEVVGVFYVWYVETNDGKKEVDVFRSLNAAEWAVRRALRASGSDDYLLDADGTFLELGISTGHYVKKETRSSDGI